MKQNLKFLLIAIMVGSSFWLSIEEGICLNELTVEAQSVTKADDCPTQVNSDCHNTETGNIYVGKTNPRTVDPIEH